MNQGQVDTVVSVVVFASVLADDLLDCVAQVDCFAAAAAPVGFVADG